MDDDKQKRINRVLKELDNYPTKQWIDKAPYEFRQKRKSRLRIRSI